MKSGVLALYVFILLAVIGFFVGGTYYYRQTKKLHFHHYWVGYCVVLFIGYQTIYSAALAGFFMGIMVEGASHYGFDPIWVPK